MPFSKKNKNHYFLLFVDQRLLPVGSICFSCLLYFIFGSHYMHVVHRKGIISLLFDLFWRKFMSLKIMVYKKCLWQEHTRFPHTTHTSNNISPPSTSFPKYKSNNYYLIPFPFFYYNSAYGRNNTGSRIILPRRQYIITDMQCKNLNLNYDLQDTHMKDMRLSKKDLKIFNDIISWWRYR